MEDPLFEKNVKVDPKHSLPTTVAGPQDSSKLEVLRCYQGCNALWTEFELRRYGLCPVCKNHKFNRAYPHRGLLGFPSSEMIRIRFWDLLRNWRVHGPKGWGWKNGAPIDV